MPGPRSLKAHEDMYNTGNHYGMEVQPATQDIVLESSDGDRESTKANAKVPRISKPQLTYIPYPDVFVIRVVQGATATATLVNNERTNTRRRSAFNDQRSINTQ
ncbi:uncharacterized protein H6S33_004546 [Morchella sextelata]|uniref:uncharacterized protein n=1 Tax=Morchella sextelata TaxID=1174677 RepID=UPI001D03A5F7|nr:uncharacterized protein H6S33_004546 [Morchella sextelata]KAH0605324.1 hypothetical protein H6S33_004546 [Morchella sextelata]